MRLRTSGAAILLTLLGVSKLPAATPQEVWPMVGTQADSGTLDSSCMALELEPALRFQHAFRKILSGAPSSDWRPNLETLSNPQQKNAVSDGVRQVALVWIARAEMAEIDAILLDYYRHKVHFPRSSQEFQRLLPPALAKDPWGNDWVYQPKSPEGFTGIESQRYDLWPRQLSHLASLSDVVRGRRPVTFDSAIVPHDLNGKTALEIHSGNSTSLIEPGGKAGNDTLLFVGNKWALMAASDQLFAVAF